MERLVVVCSAVGPPIEALPARRAFRAGAPADIVAPAATAAMVKAATAIQRNRVQRSFESFVNMVVDLTSPGHFAIKRPAPAFHGGWM
jgi:hypothetical protein